MERVTLTQDVVIKGLLLHAGSQVSLAPVVARDWVHRGWVKLEGKKRGRKPKQPVDVEPDGTDGDSDPGSDG